jgi:polyhydroxyalkanoate synthesis repressor PhaR
LSDDFILITRYSSRRLYNTNTSEYVTLDEVYTLIKEGKNIKIIDKQTQEDLTKQYLLQIISEIENKEGNVLPENMLTEIIKSYSNATQKLMPDMVAKTFEFYKNQQNEFLKHLNTKDVNPFLDETTNEAVKDWQSKQFQIMNNFFNPWEKSGTDKSSEDKESSLSEKDEIEILKRQMSELNEELNKKK